MKKVIGTKIKIVNFTNTKTVKPNTFQHVYGCKV